jgi:Family of unknown function (DUF5908)
MCIEIRELVIKATLAQDNKSGPQPLTNTQSTNASTNNEQLINTCVEKVMEILKSKNQR